MTSIPTDEGAAGPDIAHLGGGTQHVRKRVHSDEAAPVMRHTGECATDDISRQVCEDIYRERCDDNLALCEALRAVYALYGEDKQVKKIVHDAIKAHGIDHE